MKKPHVGVGKRLVLIKQLFSVEECEEIIKNIGRTTNIIVNDITPKPGVVVHERIEQICKRHFSLLDKDNHLWMDRIKEHLDVGMVCKTGTHLVEYVEGGYVHPHTDNITKPDRKLSAITLVSPKDFEGGNFYLEEEHILLEQGDTVVFDSGILHSVTEVTKGRRIATVNWWY